MVLSVFRRLRFAAGEAGENRIFFDNGQSKGNKQGCQMVCFQNQKSKFGQILEGLAKEDDGIFYGHSVHFTDLCYILWTFGIVRGNLVYFSPFWYFEPRKIWQTWVTNKTGLGRVCVSSGKSAKTFISSAALSHFC
jgi:hypothetical protein